MKTFNLLPEDRKKTLRREYRVKLAVLSLAMSSITGIIVLIFLLPSFLSISFRHSEVSLELKNLKRDTPELLVIEDLKSELKQINSKLMVLESKNIILPSEVIEKIIGNQSAGISPNLFLFDLRGEQAGLKISGVATNRETLTDFVKNLRQEENFTEVNLPVSDLAEDKDINFSITFAAGSKL
jgi:Tfp pilus assembly protein PilN